MLVFADTAGQVFAAASVFLSGILITFFLGRFFEIRQQRALFFYFWHSTFCLFYFYYSLNNGADSTQYYIASQEYNQGFKFGTDGINYLTSYFSAVGLSYGGIFLIFNIFGFVGMLSFASALQHVTTAAGHRARQIGLAIILMPGLSFWSSAIGKDALTFMAAGLATWGALDLSRRYPALFTAALAFLFARPHMAGVLLVSIALALVFASSIHLAKKALLLALAIPATVLGFGFGLEYAGLGQAEGLSDVGKYFETRQGLNLEGGSSVDIASMSVPMRMMTYVFRPFFFDAEGIFGLVVSFENFFLSCLILGSTFTILKRGKSKIDSFAFLFFLSFTIVSWFILANTTANLGIAIRQKWMFLPMLLLLAISSLYKVRR